MRIGVSAAFLAISCVASAAVAGPVPQSTSATQVLVGAGISSGILRADLAASERPRAFRLDDQNAAVHRRLLGTMLDYYPFGTSGLHLSGGTLRTRGTAGGQTQARIVSVGRRDFGYHALRERFAPLMTVGYTLPLAEAMQAGFEVGGMSGVRTAVPGGPTSMFLGDSGMRRARIGSGMNAIANLAFGYKF